MNTSIIGITTINHKIRVKLKLNLQEYCLMAFLSEWHKVNVIAPTTQDYMIHLGVNSADNSIIYLLSQLNTKGFITLDHKVTELWDSEFRMDSSEGFNILWKAHSKGNKKTAKQRYDKVLKKVSHDELLAKLTEYIESNEFQYLKGLDVWLNPEKEHWKDPIVYKDGKKPENKEIPLHLQGMVM